MKSDIALAVCSLLCLACLCASGFMVHVSLGVAGLGLSFGIVALFLKRGGRKRNA